MENKVKNWIDSNKKINFELKYRMSRDGVDFNSFYSKAEGVFPNLLLISDLNGGKFGGFITVSWDKN